MIAIATKPPCPARRVRRQGIVTGGEPDLRLRPDRSARASPRGWRRARRSSDVAALPCSAVVEGTDRRLSLGSQSGRPEEGAVKATRRKRRVFGTRRFPRFAAGCEGVGRRPRCQVRLKRSVTGSHGTSGSGVSMLIAIAVEVLRSASMRLQAGPIEPSVAGCVRRRREIRLRRAITCESISAQLKRGGWHVACLRTRRRSAQRLSVHCAADPRVSSRIP